MLPKSDGLSTLPGTLQVLAQNTHPKGLPPLYHHNMDQIYTTRLQLRACPAALGSDRHTNHASRVTHDPNTPCNHFYTYVEGMVARRYPRSVSWVQAHTGDTSGP